MFNLPPKVFISYSHEDREFVSCLANSLIDNHILVWWDELEINVGDSLLDKIQEGILTSSYLMVVLSPDSVNSAWVNEELKSAMVLQFQHQRTVVLPILLYDCEIPLFLREKRYADFREDYENGLQELLKSIQPPDTFDNSRVGDEEFFHDYSIDWSKNDHQYTISIEITTHGSKLPYSVNCKLYVVSKGKLSERLEQFEREGFVWAINPMIFIQVRDIIANIKPIILIEGDSIAEAKYKTKDSKVGTEADLTVNARRLGSDPGEDILYDWSIPFFYIAEKHEEGINSALSQNEHGRFQNWRKNNPL